MVKKRSGECIMLMRIPLLTQFKCVCACQPGEEFYVEDCQLKCKCDAPFVTCVASECPPLHECKLQGGELGCYPTGKNTPTEHMMIMNDTEQNGSLL